MTALLDHEHRLAGTVKFEASVSVEKLADFISEMKERAPERWVDLHIRRAGFDETYYLAFHCLLEDGEKSTQEEEVQTLLQHIRDQFGSRPMKGGEADPLPRGVLGWDIAPVKIMA